MVIDKQNMVEKKQASGSRKDTKKENRNRKTGSETKKLDMVEGNRT